MITSLVGKVAAITGASQGIGLAVAQAFIGEGAKVVLMGRSIDKLNKVCDRLGDNAIPCSIDVTNDEDVLTMADTILDMAGGLDIFCPNAGSFVGGSVINGDSKEWDEMMNVTVNSVFKTTKAVLPKLVAQGSGDIMFTGSVAGMKPFGICPVYSGAKAAVHNFAHSLAEDIANTGVRVSVLAPGPVETPLLNDWDQDVLEQVRENGKLLLAEDIARAAVFVATSPPHVRIPIMNIMPAGDVQQR